MADASVEEMAVAFGRLLRSSGLDVPVGSVTVFVAALGAVGIGSRQGVYWAGRATLVRRPEDVDVYDRAFSAFWLGRAAERTIQPPAVPIEVAVDAPDGSRDGPNEVEDTPSLVVHYSPVEILRHKDFASYTPGEFAEARRLIADLRLAGALRRSRRARAAKRDRGRPDLRGTVRNALRSGGEPVRRSFREPSVRPRRIVLICDVSGSM